MKRKEKKKKNKMKRKEKKNQLKDYFSLVKLMLDENCKRIFEIIVRLFESFEGIYKKQWK